MKVKWVLVFFLAIFLLNSCSISRRYHHRGWNIDVQWPSVAQDQAAKGSSMNRKAKDITVQRSEREVADYATPMAESEWGEEKSRTGEKQVEFSQMESQNSSLRLGGSAHDVSKRPVISPTDSMKRAARVNKIRFLEMRGDDYLDIMRGCVAAIVFFWPIVFATGGGGSSSSKKVSLGVILFVISLLFVPFLVLFSLLYVINELRLFVLRNQK
jgi:hypothetical protein